LSLDQYINLKFDCSCYGINDIGFVEFELVKKDLPYYEEIIIPREL
jgi:hypothetical protein